MKQLFGPLIRILRGKDAGVIGACLGFVFALLLVICGLLKSFFILILTIGFYIIGVNFFNHTDQFYELLDRIFPPCRFR